MSRKILVTGSLGQLGSFLAENLIQDGIDVIGLDKRVKQSSNVPEKIKKITIRGDICNITIVNKVLNDVKTVVHCAAQIISTKSINDPIFDAKNNIIGTINLLQASVKHSIRRFVYISSAATYGNPIALPIREEHPQNPISPYGVSKLAGEVYVDMYWRTYKLPTVIIRPFNFYSERADPKSPYSGVITKFINRVKTNKPPIIEGDGEQTRDFVYVRDVIQMIRLAMEKKEAIGESFNCGSGKPITINRLANIIIEASGKKLEPIYVEQRKGDIKYSYADISKAQRILGYESKVKLKDGLNNIINYKTSGY